MFIFGFAENVAECLRVVLMEIGNKSFQDFFRAGVSRERETFQGHCS